MATKMFHPYFPKLVIIAPYYTFSILSGTIVLISCPILQPKMENTENVFLFKVPCTIE